MKSRILKLFTAMTFLAALAVPVRLAAQEQKQLPPHYTVTDLGTLGGTFSHANGITNNGFVDGYSTLPGDTALHAFLYQRGVMTDLGTLGGPNSVAEHRPSERGEVGGTAETSTPDPNGENWLGSGTISMPFVWRDGVMSPLPTLGGDNGEANVVNNRGQVIGQVETTMRDPTCVAPQLFQLKAVLWEKGEIREVIEFPGDPDQNALAINDRGQVVGGSGSCTTPFHAYLWQHGRTIDLGNLGGTMNIYALDINDRGQVVGSSNLPGDTTGHGFLWQNGVMTDLGTLPGDVSSDGDGINNLGQVVGGSCDQNFNCRAYLWQDGVMTDLNTLIPRDSSLFLIEATGTINDQGQIAGIALEINTGEVHAFLATPTSRDWEIGEKPKMVLPENVRKLLRQRRGGRIGVGLTRPQ